MSTSYAAVFEAVDACVASGRYSPTAEAALQRLLSQLRGVEGHSERVRALESLSLSLNALSLAEHRNSKEERKAALLGLQRSVEEWMQRLPLE
jgi:hypothetical protein